MNDSILQKAEDYVLHLLNSRTPVNNVYHSVEHTCEVVESCETIGTASKLLVDEIEIVMLAAWFHDVGYLEIIKGHEEISANYAEEFLADESYPNEKIKKIKSCILATKVPQSPKSNLEKVICDADLSHLGKPTFKKKNNLFREEFEFHFGKELSDREFLQSSIDFMNSHRFFTDYAIAKLEPQKQKNLIKLQKKLDKIMEKEKSGHGKKDRKDKKKKDKKQK